jgi:serine/threonine protein kinase
VETGQRLADRYEIQLLLDSGGMGQVWRARDLTLDRPVAVKALVRNLSGEKLREALARFRREALAAARLNHPSIATIYDAIEDNGQLFLVLEFVDGEDLRKTLARQPAGLPVSKVLNIGAEVAEALVVAHKAGIVHRDVKPANLMLPPHGRVKVCDFGIARLQGATASITATGTAVGTEAYMPPEQLLGKEVSGKADVYALGATLFHLLTGRVVFPGDDLEAIIAQHLTAQPPNPAALRPDCPPTLATLLQAMLAKKPSQRPAATAAAAALRALQSPPATSAKTVTTRVRAATGAFRVRRSPPGTPGSTVSAQVRAATAAPRPRVQGPGWLIRDRIGEPRILEITGQTEGVESLAFRSPNGTWRLARPKPCHLRRHSPSLSAQMSNPSPVRAKNK